MTSEGDFPKLVGTSFKTFIGDGNAIGFEIETTSGSIRFGVDPGQLPVVIGKIFTGAAEAQRRRGEAGAFEKILGDIRSTTAIANPRIYVANTIGASGRGLIGIVLEISGIPFTAALPPEACLKLADDLRSAVDDQTKQTNRKPN